MRILVLQQPGPDTRVPPERDLRTGRISPEWQVTQLDPADAAALALALHLKSAARGTDPGAEVVALHQNPLVRASTGTRLRTEPATSPTAIASPAITIMIRRRRSGGMPTAAAGTTPNANANPRERSSSVTIAAGTTHSAANSAGCQRQTIPGGALSAIVAVEQQEGMLARHWRQRTQGQCDDVVGVPVTHLPDLERHATSRDRRPIAGHRSGAPCADTSPRVQG
jgi:hypothetical protein